MSRYVQPASNAAAKICGLKRGSVALSTASALLSRISSRDGRAVGGVHRRRREAAVVEPGDDRLRAGRVDVGERDRVEERAAPGHLRGRRADASRADDEQPHSASSTSCAARMPSLAPPSM